MTEWQRLKIVSAANAVYRDRIDELEAELDRMRTMIVALESDNYDLLEELAEARRRHPSSGRA